MMHKPVPVAFGAAMAQPMPARKSAAMAQPEMAQASMKKAKAKDMKKPASEKKAAVKRATLDQIISAQHTSGYWLETSKSLFDTFIASGDSFDFDTIDEVNKAIDNCKMSAMRGVIIATLVALFILMEVFEDQEDEWTLVAKKAKTWLKSRGIDKPETYYKNMSLQI